MTGPWRSLLVVAAAVAVVHGAALDAPFHYDDHHSLVDNPAIRDVGQLPHYFLDPGLFSQRPDRAMYRPLVLASYALDQVLGDGDPAVFHLTNLFLHLATAAALLLCVRDLARSRWRARVADRLGLAAALLFAVHPLTAEPAVYVSARSESLAATLCLLSLWRLRRGGAAASALLFGGALLARSTAIMWPGVVFCLARARPGGPLTAAGAGGRRPESADGRRLWPHLGIAVVYLVGVRRLLTRAVGGEAPRGVWDQVLMQLEVTPYLARLLAVPYPLSVEHPLGGHIGGQVLHGVTALLLVSALAAAAALLSPRGRWLVLAALLPWLPVAAIPLNAPISEHRLYLSAAVAILGLAVSWGPRILAPGWPFRGALAGLLVLAGMTHLRGQAWATETRLWEAAIQVAPANPRAHFFLADAYRRQGRPEAALRAYTRADSLAEGNLEIRLSRAGQLLALGHAEPARRLLEPMARSHPDNGAVLYNLGLAVGDEDPARAEALFRAAWRARPDLLGAALELSLCLEARGDVDGAAEVLGRGLADHPGWPAGWVNLGFLRARRGDLAGARQAWERAVQLDPSLSVARDNLRRLDALERNGPGGGPGQSAP